MVRYHQSMARQGKMTSRYVGELQLCRIVVDSLYKGVAVISSNVGYRLLVENV
jgi:hypothetical protein